MRPRRALRALAAALLVALAAACAAVPARARAEEFPPQSRALLLLRVLAYDRNLKARAGRAVTVALLYRPGDRESEARCQALHQAFEDVSREIAVEGLPIKAELVPYRDAAGLDLQLERLRPSMAHLDGALSAAVLEIAHVTRRRKVLSADGSRAMAEAGLAIGIVPRSGRAGVIVNMAAARQEGAELEAGLLAVSELIRE